MKGTAKSWAGSVSLAQVQQKGAVLARRDGKIRHVLNILPAGGDWFEAPDAEAARAALARKGKKPGDLAKSPLTLEVSGGCLSVWLRLDDGKAAFDRHAALRQALKPLLDEHPGELHVALYGPEDFRVRAARDATYVVCLNGANLPAWKSEKAPAVLERVVLHGVSGLDIKREAAVAEGNTLCRQLTLLPPNLLTPATYREHIRALAKDAGWGIEEFDVRRLRKLKAGAFLAVARGSGHEDAAIVRLSYSGKKAKGGTLALVGKGICFDTGGHNLKPARYMAGMHEDMAGSAVVLGILLAATRLKLPVAIDAWLALARNDLSPAAYCQGDVVEALDGTTVEIVHTDAEGRLVLADTLALAVRDEPDLVLDFATLTGSLITALGTRYGGVFSPDPELLAAAVAAGKGSGERMCALPMDEDYEADLDSLVADIKQCTLESDADHILAARFLKRFVGERPWLHVDLAAATCKGGLGGIASAQTGFGIAWGIAFLSERLQ